MKLLDFLKVTEGMDNAFFLSKDLSSGPTIYPVPDDSKEYEDIDSERRGGAKVKVRGNKTARDKKAKHAG